MSEIAHHHIKLPEVNRKANDHAKPGAYAPGHAWRIAEYT